MNYEFNDSEKTFIAAIQACADELDRTQTLESADAGIAEAALRAALAALAPTGYLDAGFQGAGPSRAALLEAMTAVAAVSPSLLLGVESATRIFGSAVNAWGDDDAKARWLTPLTQGRMLGAVALSETALNVENEPLATEAVDEGGALCINGQKQFVVNGPAADWIAVAGRLEEKPALFLVEKGAKGLILEPPDQTLGYDGALIGSLRLEDCRVDSGQVLRPGGEKEMLDRLRFWENQVLVAASLGMMRASFEAARDYAKTHQSGGRPVIAYQEVGFKLSEMLTLFQTAQLMAYRAAWATETTPKDAPLLTLCTKVFCSESAEQVAGQALQILAATGFRAGHAAERAYRSAKYNQIAGTSTEIARVKIGDQALGY